MWIRFAVVMLFVGMEMVVGAVYTFYALRSVEERSVAGFPESVLEG